MPEVSVAPLTVFVASREGKILEQVLASKEWVIDSGHPNSGLK